MQTGQTHQSRHRPNVWNRQACKRPPWQPLPCLQFETGTDPLGTLPPTLLCSPSCPSPHTHTESHCFPLSPTNSNSPPHQLALQKALDRTHTPILRPSQDTQRSCPKGASLSPTHKLGSCLLVSHPNPVSRTHPAPQAAFSRTPGARSRRSPALPHTRPHSLRQSTAQHPGRPLDPRRALTRCQAPAPEGTGSSPSCSAGTTWQSQRERAGPGAGTQAQLRPPTPASEPPDPGADTRPPGDLTTRHATTSGLLAQCPPAPAAPALSPNPRPAKPAPPPPPAWRSARPGRRNVALKWAGPGGGGAGGRAGGGAAHRGGTARSVWGRERRRRGHTEPRQEHRGRGVRGGATARGGAEPRRRVASARAESQTLHPGPRARSLRSGRKALRSPFNTGASREPYLSPQRVTTTNTKLQTPKQSLLC